MEWLRMSRISKLSLTGLILLVVIGSLCWGAITVKRRIGRPEIRKADVFLSTKLQTADEMREPCPTPIPDTASNVQYAVWSFGEVTQSWIRFEAPAADCLAHATSMVQHFRNREGYAVTATPIAEDTGVLCVLDPTEVDLSWFEDCQDATGLVFRVSGGRAPVIWVDTNRGVFYCEVKNECHSLSSP